MTNPARTRIGRVTLKDGGASVRVLYSPERQSNRGKIEREVRRCLDTMDQKTTGPVGFSFVVWSADRKTMVDMWVTAESTIPFVMIPAFSAANLQREIIADHAAHVVNLGYCPDNISS